MKFLNWKMSLCTLAVLAMSCVAAVAQDGTDGPPKILQIVRETLKTTSSGTAHEKTESAYVHALAAAKAKPRYLALTSMSGEPRALFFSGYDSLGAWQDETTSVDKIPGLSAGLDRVSAVDGELLNGMSMSVWNHRTSMSMNEHGLKGERFMEIEQYNLKPGHQGEWEELVKMVLAGYKKGIPDASWSVYEEVYGQNGDSFLVLGPLKSLAEEDQHMATGKKFAEAMGPEGLKKLDAMMADCVESHNTNLFAFSPKMSYPPQAWTDAEPGYWKQPKMGAEKKK
jgi:hypothetical protein